MSATITSTVVDPHALSATTKQRLIDELYETHSEIFDGVTRAEFARYVVDSPADRTRIQVYREQLSGRVVGYFSIHTFVRTIEGRRWVVLRAEMGKLASHRRGAKASLMIAEVARACILYPFARKAYLGCFVHPSAYVALGHVAPEMYPHWNKPTPAPIQTAMEVLAEEFGLDPVEASGAGVREVGWVTREGSSERESWERRDCEMSRYYMRRNPHYDRGHGLVVLAPISPVALIDGSLRQGRRVLRRRLGGRAGSPHRAQLV